MQTKKKVIWIQNIHPEDDAGHYVGHYGDEENNHQKKQENKDPKLGGGGHGGTGMPLWNGHSQMAFADLFSTGFNIK